MKINQKLLHRVLRDPFFSLLLLLILVGGLYYIAENVTESYRKKPDFGGMIIIRQADMGSINSRAETKLTRDEILEHITDKKVLLPIAEQYDWNTSFEDMKKRIDVRERLTSRNSFVIHINTGNIKCSANITKALAQSFIAQYKAKWKLRSRNTLKECQDRICKYEKDLQRLLSLKEKFHKKEDLLPVNTEIEMKAINEQLAAAQTQFLNAYGSYINSLELKRAEIQLKYDLARQIYTPDDRIVKNLSLQHAELERQCAKLREALAKQKPDLYRLNFEPKKLTGLPNHILYYYDTIQNLQQLKLSMMLKSLIEEKEKMLEHEKKTRNTINRLLESDSCDVFIREV